MVTVEYIQNGYPLSIWDTREVDEIRAKHLVQMGMVKIVSNNKTQNVSKQAKQEKKAWKQNKTLINKVKSMLWFWGKKNKKIDSANNK